VGQGDSLGAGRTGGLAFVGMEGGWSDSLSEETRNGQKSYAGGCEESGNVEESCICW